MSAYLSSFEDRFLPEVRDIFFESSTRKTFANTDEREAFFYKYVGFYLSRYRDLCLLALEGDKVLGYILGSPTSDDAELLRVQPHLQTFASDFKLYPAHLHINLHESSRGKGLGQILVNAWEQKLRDRNIQGLHIMTSPDALNKSFYSRLGFHYENEQSFQGYGILLMGKSLSEN